MSSSNSKTIANSFNVGSVVSVMTITTMTFLTISTLFCLSFMVGVVDDMVYFISPRITRLIQHIHKQLCYIAEWEKEKRESWNNQQYQDSIDNRLHSLILNLAGVMNDYIKNNK